MPFPPTPLLARLSLLFLTLPTHLFPAWIEPPLETEAGYPVPQPGVSPTLPEAHGAHRAYGIEWWYWVGHLQTIDGGERFGFQSTVFRVAGKPEESASSARDFFGHRQLFMSHAALSEIDNKRYRHSERVYREGWQAQAETGRLGLQVGAIHAREREDGPGFAMRMHLPDDAELRLNLRPVKPLVAFGERGLSRKGSDPAAVSWYWTYPRVEAEGILIRRGETTQVRGIAWMDHEISSRQLGSDLEGWDWTCLQLDDGTEIKAYRLRRPDGTSDPWSAVYWIDQDGELRSVDANNFSWKEEGVWTSPTTELAYPTRVIIQATDPKDGSEKIYRLRPLLENQEFVGTRGNNAYWEGACEVLDESGQQIGLGYLELAGYGGGLSGQLD